MTVATPRVLLVLLITLLVTLPPKRTQAGYQDPIVIPKNPYNGMIYVGFDVLLIILGILVVLVAAWSWRYHRSPKS